MRKITHLWGWQRQELDAFLREFVQRGCLVIPVLLADAPQEPARPVFLRAMTWGDFRRQNPDPMRQLLWGITGKQEATKVIQAGLICPKCGFQNRRVLDFAGETSKRSFKNALISMTLLLLLLLKWFMGLHVTTLSDLAGLPFVMRGKDYQLLLRAEVQFRLFLPPDQQFSRTESAFVRTLYDCPEVTVGPGEQRCRVVVATHPAGPRKLRVGVERDGIVYELFLTTLPQGAFTAADVVALYLHRGAFENALSDEDSEQEPDRWCSHAAWGQECWQIVAQWVWNLRLELGHHLLPDPVRTTEFAPAHLAGQASVAGSTSPVQGYGPADVATGWKAGRFSGRDFPFQPDGTLRCPAGQKLSAHERRREADGSLRVVYAASIRNCRSCLLREQCQWQGKATAKPRQVSVLLHPLKVGSAPLLWRDWSRRRHRRACMHLLRQQHVAVQIEREPAACSLPPLLSRASGFSHLSPAQHLVLSGFHSSGQD
jgi:hypothetical protein